jgi:hypothetical protein
LKSDLSPPTNSPSNITNATYSTGNLSWHFKYTQKIPGESKGSFCDLSQFSKATDSEKNILDEVGGQFSGSGEINIFANPMRKKSRFAHIQQQ